MKVRTKKMLVFGIGGALIVIGCIVGGCWQLIFEKILHDNIALTPTSTSYELWRDTPVPMYLDIYLWNWTNPEDVLNAPKDNPVKPILVEHGPYVFSEVHNKVNITFNNNDTVTFLQKRIWQFEPSQSTGQLTDIIVSVNVIASTVAYAIRDKGELLKIVLNYVLKRLESTIYIAETAEKWMFEGYDDKLLTLAKRLNLTNVELPFSKFGWFVERNGSAEYDGVFNMHTGTGDVSKLGDVHAWKYQTETKLFQPPCNKVYGGLGELGPPLAGVQEVNIFAPDFCTAFPMSLDGELDIFGVVGNKYVGKITPFDNGYTDSSKKCYCTIENGTQKCELPGIVNVSKCKFGAPVYVSYPHFYLGDQSYRDAVTGMAPEKELHQFVFGAEPVSGIPLSVRGNLQINFKLESYAGLDMFANVPNLFLPAIWFTQRVDLPEDKISLVKLLVMIPAIGMGTFFGIAGIGVLMVVIGLVITVRKGWKGEEGDKLVSSSHQH